MNFIILPLLYCLYSNDINIVRTGCSEKEPIYLSRNKIERFYSSKENVCKTIDFGKPENCHIKNICIIFEGDNSKYLVNLDCKTVANKLK